MIRSCVSVAVALLVFAFTQNVLALPAFALREHVSCVVCHTNGSAPHLTKFGFEYRRAGFRFPSLIGDVDHDNAEMKLTEHMAAGVNVDYQVTTNGADTSSQQLTHNEFNMREAEIWPVVGAFLGNYATWSELDMTPGAGSGPGATQNAEVNVESADLRYVTGNQNFFYSVRAGLISPEGYGASDQWIDDGALPLMDLLAPFYNESTLAQPFGAMNQPQMGVEFGFNWPSTYLTLGVLNGFNGANLDNNGKPTLTPELMNQQAKLSKDVLLQWDQFYGDKWATTVAYYNGHINMQDPSNKLTWDNAYQDVRVYGTYSVLPGTVDLLAGLGYGQYHYVNSGSNVVAGQFGSRGGFVGLNYYVMPHLTLSGRYDYFEYGSSPTGSPKARSLALLASVPLENTMFVFHYIRTTDETPGQGLTNDFRAEWRFLF